MVAHRSQRQNISSIARLTGLPWYAVATLIEHYSIRTEEVGGQRLIHVEDLGRLLDILRQHPGVRGQSTRPL